MTGTRMSIRRLLNFYYLFPCFIPPSGHPTPLLVTVVYARTWDGLARQKGLVDIVAQRGGAVGPGIDFKGFLRNYPVGKDPGSIGVGSLVRNRKRPRTCRKPARHVGQFKDLHYLEGLVT